jgi:putative endonuclease
MMRDEISPAVYIMASRYRGTIYIGVTGNLYDRVLTHKEGQPGSFTAKYGIKTLVWYEHHESMDNAILRETQLKVWKRAWKIELIETCNRDWNDLHNRVEFRPAQPPKRGSISRAAAQRLDGMTGMGKSPTLE